MLVDAAWAATLLVDQEEACVDRLYLIFSSLAAFGRNPAAPSTDGKTSRAAGQCCAPSSGVFPAGRGRTVVLRFFLIYFIQFSRQGLGLQNDEIHRGDIEDSCSHVQLGVRVGPARGPSVPLASCPWLSPVLAQPGGTRSSSVEQAPSIGSGHAVAPALLLEMGPGGGLGGGSTLEREQLKSCCAFGGFHLRRESPPFPPLLSLGTSHLDGFPGST